MAAPPEAIISRRSTRQVVGTVVGVMGFAASLTLLSRGMRSVMHESGGFCAVGGPYEIARPCPKGVAWLVPVSIWTGLAFLGIYAVSNLRHGVGRVLLAWPALFLSLGWNFLELGIDPPGPGVSPGWLVCGVVFVVMGGGPLVPWVLTSTRWRRLRGQAAGNGGDPEDTGSAVSTRRSRTTEIASHLVLVAVGIAGGYRLFDVFTR